MEKFEKIFEWTLYKNCNELSIIPEKQMDYILEIEKQQKIINY